MVTMANEELQEFIPPWPESHQAAVGDLATRELQDPESPLAQALSATYGHQPEAYGAAGNGTTDDTAAVQAAVNAGKRFIGRSGAIYRLTAPVTIPVGTVRDFDGGNALFVVDGNFEGLQFVGDKTGSASPGDASNIALGDSQQHPIIRNLRVRGTGTGGTYTGVGLSVTGAQAVVLTGIEARNLATGLRLKGIVRNLAFTNLHIYNCSAVGLHFDPTCDLHQLVGSASHISYCGKAIYSENATIHNVYLSALDLETSEEVVAPSSVVHIKASTARPQKWTFASCGFEDHDNGSNPDPIVNIDGGTANTASGFSQFVFTSSTFANSRRGGIRVANAGNVVIEGNTFDSVANFAVDIAGNVYSVVVSGNVVDGVDTANGEKGFVRLVGDDNARSVRISGNQVSNMSVAAIAVSGPMKLETLVVDDNSIGYQSGTLAAVTAALLGVSATSIDLLSVKGNLIRCRDYTTGAPVSVSVGTIRAGTLRDNLAFGTTTAHALPAASTTLVNDHNVTVPTPPPPSFFTDFSAETVGAAPANWTQQWSAGNWAIATDAGAVGGKVLRESTGGTTKRGFAWAVPGNVSALEIVFKWRTSSTGAPVRAILRGTGTAGAETGYFGAMQNSTTQSFGRLNAASQTLPLGATSAFTYAANTWYTTRIRIDETTIKARTWLSTDAEPTTWAISDPVGSIAAAGWVGFYSATNGTRDIDWVGVSLGGTAPTS